MVVTTAIPRSFRVLGRTPVSPSSLVSSTICPECGADTPIPTPEGYIVCAACGLEYPDSQPYMCSDAPSRGGGILQAHMILAPHTRRTIGTKAEQVTLSRALAWAEKFAATYEQEVFTRAYFEIRKMFAVLNLEGRDTIFDVAMAGLAKAYRNTPRGTLCHNVHLLSLVACYRALRTNRIPINLKMFLAACLDRARHTAGQFLTVLKDTVRWFPKEDQGEIIRREVSALITRLDIPKAVADVAGTILKYHNSAFHSPKTTVRAAAIVATAALATDTRARFPLSAIGKAAGIATSALIRCITDACSRHRPIEGSVTRAGELLRSLFVSQASSHPTQVAPRTSIPRVNLAARVTEVIQKVQLPGSITRVVVQEAMTHAKTFFQRSDAGNAGTAIPVTIFARNQRSSYSLQAITRQTSTNYPTLVWYMPIARTRVVKFAEAGYHLRACFLSTNSSTLDVRLAGPPPGHLSSPVPKDLPVGPPSSILQASPN